MAQASLQEMAREVVMYSDGVCPILLAQRWVRDRYRKICDKHLWSFKVGRGAFGTSAVYNTGTITLTNGSATVTGSGTTFTSGMVGRQLKVNGFIFTISAFASTTSITIDETWLGATAAGNSYTIVTAYITPTETDFHAYYSVIDPSNNWKLHLGYDARILDRIDARRSSTGQPYIVAMAGVRNSSGDPMFEIWPHPTAQKMYTYTYERRVPDLTEADTPPTIIRSDILVKGALADLARWPGTPERKNPLYDPYLMQWKARETEFVEEYQRAIVEDQSIFQNDFTSSFGERYYPLDANFMQAHAFPQ
jgi:hypothetical protein